ncbi:MAG TPA: histidine kinase [Noviherbaspirillum sp.]|uniref:sensor histidine kinase n=1 Tax=Noviherbaspirillum sp. TaxID=1926288 RepID=UPI002D302F3E|nr:histidine kinase [Noviherbaspirillum sp.]HYD97417.1 histidine kinase [Noviherbaspirillum sp.]
MNTALPVSAAPYPRLRRFAIDFLITQVFNLIIAVLITYVVRAHDSFFTNLVISVCIGSLAVTFIDGGRLLLWREDRPPRVPFALLVLASFAAAQFFGKIIASQLLDIPLTEFSTVRGGNAAAMLIGSTFTFAFIIWFFWSRARMAYLSAAAEAEKARAAAVERQAMQAQLQMLQAQIEPHMLFNTLANLQGLIAVDPARAQRMLEQLIQYLRATLSSSRAEQVPLAHEFSLMDAYLGLMKVRMGSRLAYTLDLPPALKDLQVPPMLLQPLAENAIKHGLEPKVEGGSITVRAERRGDALLLTVADTGLGLDGAPASDGTRVGLSNIRERLQALYGVRGGFSLLPNTPNGVIAQITIPL